MATTTPRIGLTKPDGTDLVDIAVLNTNFDKIDSNIASTKIQATKPATANAGDLWWDSDTGTLYLYYTDANSSQWVAATSDPINIGVVASQAERDAQYPTPAQGMSVYRTDLGVTQRYYGLFNASTNPGGRDTAGWYDTEKSVGLIPLKPTTATFVSGTGSVNSLGAVTFTNCTYVILDGVFSTKYRNYIIECELGGPALGFQLRVGGASNSTNNYSLSGYYTNGTGTVGVASQQYLSYMQVGWAATGHVTLKISSPAHAKATNIVTQEDGYDGGTDRPHHTQLAGYFGQTTAFDGFQIYGIGGGASSGVLSIYGLAE